MTERRPFHDETRSTILERRLVTISRSVLLFVVLTITFPIALGLAVLVDLGRWIVTRRPWMAVRLLLFGWIYLAAELVGLAWLSLGYLVSGFGRSQSIMLRMTWPVQTWWASTLFSSVQRLLQMTLVVEGADLAAPGPLIAMFRHASIVDNLLPAVLFGRDADMKLRWILKRELLAVPALDVAGTRLPNYFVDRNSSDPRGELRKIRRLGTDLGHNEGVLIYPEGTRFTEQRRVRALEQLEDRDPELYEHAAGLEHVMPPRIGGPITLLDLGYDVVLCAHEGLDGFARISDVWSGDLVGSTVHVKLWRFPASSIPPTRKERVTWMFDQWKRIDQWIDTTKQADEARLTPPRA